MRPAIRLRTGVVALFVLCLDLATKAIVSGSLGLYERHELLPFLAVFPVHNPGLSLTFLANGVYLPIYLLIGLVLFVAIRVVNAPPTPLSWLPAGLLLGGAFGNLLDRLYQGYVTDFIQIHGWGEVFNLADLSIVLGLILSLVLSIWRTADEMRRFELPPTTRSSQPSD